MHISASITDFPIFSRIETFFREFKNAGCDGVELVVGFKSRWQMDTIWEFSRKYNLPITSIHQPPWSGMGLYLDEGFVKEVVKRGSKNIVFHTMTYPRIDSKSMTGYFEHLARLQDKYQISVLLENGDDKKSSTIFDYIAPNKSEDADIEQIFAIAQKYNFQMTYDTSHAKYKKPHEEKSFQKALHRIGNIHLSSFTDMRQHLPLDMGDLDTKGFLKFLKNKKYRGLLTLEVYYPNLLTFINYDFSAIQRSVKIVKKV